jgi:cytochrome c biogenesis protein CcmG, thiol:disulfide interchange protein DsbE
MNKYDLLELTPSSTAAELEAAYAAKRAAYDPARLAGMGQEILDLAQLRLAQLEAAYRSLRPALALPPRLSGDAERRRDRETIVALLAFLAIALLVLVLRNVAVPERSVTAQGAEAAALTAKPAPDFTLEALDGSQVSLSQYRGQVVLVNFWATWCPPCVREMPSLVRVYEQYKGQGFVILGINTTYQDDRAKVAQFARDNSMGFPVLLVTDPEATAAYGSRLMPTSYLIDRNGKIVYTRVGQVDEQNLSERVAALLDEPAPQP